MKYVIGIDSGGTHYRMKASDLEGNVLASHVGFPANHYYMNQEEMMRRIDESIDNLLSQFSGKREDAEYLVCGTTGMDGDADRIKLQSFYESIAGIRCPIKIMNDAELAHYTVTGGQGILVISGTGSIAFGRNKDGESARSGGWLFTILGDEGSGAWVSRRALRYLGRYFDGAVTESPLVKLVKKHLKLNNRDDLNRVAHSMGMQPWHTPDLGKIVDEAAKEEDEEALDILKTAAEHIFNIVKDLVVALRIEQTEPDFNLGLWGSNLLNSQVIQNRFLELVNVRYPRVNICYAKNESIDGAVSMALKLNRGESIF